MVYYFMTIDFDILFQTSCRYLGADSSMIKINLHFVDKNEICELNGTHRSKNKPTDVLSFPLLKMKAGNIPTKDAFPNDIDPQTGKLELGDIIICKDMA